MKAFGKRLKPYKPRIAPEIREYFEVNYLSSESPGEFLQGLKEATGEEIGWKTARVRASSWGISSARVKNTGYSVTEIVNAVASMGSSVRPESIYSRINNGTLKATRSRGFLCVPAAEAEALIDYYTAKPPLEFRGQAVITTQDADRRLGYHASCGGRTLYIYKAGHIRGYKIRRTVYLLLSDVEAAERYLKRTGKTWVPWEKPKLWRDL